MKVLSVLVCIFLGLGLSLGFLFMVKNTAEAAPEAPNTTRCVRPGGGGGCYASIQAAVDASEDGDVIRVAQGEYYERVVVTKTLVLQGGWDTAFAARDWLTYRTTIDAAGLGSAVRFDGSTGPISPTIEGFFITNGDASSYLGWGGGILAQGAWGESGLVTIRSNTIYDNVACKLDTCQGYGGGIMVYSSRSIIEDNFIQNNIARTAGRGNGLGGGIAIMGYPGDASLSGNQIEGNTAVISTTGTLSAGKGGGLWSDSGGYVTATGNWMSENVAAEKGPGYGGGVYAYGDYYGNEIISNTASLDGPGYGGGVYGYYTPDFHDNLVRGNVASQNATGSGGGIYAIYLRDARGNTIWNNRATQGGGVYYSEYIGNQRFHENLVARNTADGTDTTVPDGGGGILSQADWVEITNNQILTNTALAGGGLLVTAGDGLLLEGNLVRGNLSVAGGGLYLQDAGGKLLHNRIAGNGAFWWGGGLYLTGSSSPQMDRNIILNNTAAGNSGVGAGGVAIVVSAGTQVTMTNTLIALNKINSGLPSGVLCYSGACSLIHCTIVDNKFGADPGEGVRIVALGGENRVWNSIIAGHSTGVAIGGSPAVVLDYNDYYDNTEDVSLGTSPGAHSLFEAPLFVNRLAGDYHLSAASPLINAGDPNLSVPLDLEGQPRLLVPDIGADEYIFKSLYLPSLMMEFSPFPHR